MWLILGNKCNNLKVICLHFVIFLKLYDNKMRTFSNLLGLNLLRLFCSQSLQAIAKAQKSQFELKSNPDQFNKSPKFQGNRYDMAAICNTSASFI